MSIEDNIARIRENIARSSQNPDNVTLMAVTKNRSIDEIMQAIQCGITVIGENRAQELISKYDALKGRCDIQFIGHLQSNKINQIFDKVSMIQSLDSRRLAHVLENKAAQLGKEMKVLVQVNTGAEESKTGFLFDEVSGFLDEAFCYPHLKICGLMAVLPVDHGKKKESEAFFDKMFQLFVDMKAKKADNINMGILSMGMSNDYELAVAHGANLVRVGSEIFGPRNYI